MLNGVNVGVNACAPRAQALRPYFLSLVERLDDLYFAIPLAHLTRVLVGKGDCKGCALTHLAVDGDRPLVAVDNFLGDRQSQPRAPHCART